MEIIEKPDVNNWKYIHTCFTCGCKLKVEANDVIKHHIDGDPREPAYDSFSAICLVCKTSFGIPSKDIPKFIQFSAKDYTSHTGGQYDWHG